MSKYIIMHGSQWHETFDNRQEAERYYDELMDEEGAYFDLVLCEVVKEHEATNPSDVDIHPHWHINPAPSPTTESRDDIAKNWKRAMKNIHSEWFNKGKY